MVEQNNNVINSQRNALAKSQCKGMTKAGSRFKRSAGSSGFCYQQRGQKLGIVKTFIRIDFSGNKTNNIE